MVAPMYDQDMDFFLPSPILPRFGACDVVSCPNAATRLCDDCEVMEHCQECIDMFMDRSVSFCLFIEGAPAYTCIYCFVELQQHGELQKPCVEEKEEQPER